MCPNVRSSPMHSNYSHISSDFHQNIFKLPRGTLQEDIEEQSDGDFVMTFVIIVTNDIR